MRSYPYPQDRSRDRKAKGDQPYKDDREALAQKDGELHDQVAAQNEPDFGPSSTEEVSAEIADRLRRVNEAIEEKHRQESQA